MQLAKWKIWSVKFYDYFPTKKGRVLVVNQTSKDNSNLGAPTKYDAKKYPEQAAFLARRGITQADIADFFHVTTRTLRNWMAAHVEFAEAMASNNEAFDERVERALAERALGYEVDEVQWFNVDKTLVSKTVRKHYPPDVTACIFWLKNRQGDRWRDVQRHEISATLKSSEELRQDLLSEFKDLVDQGLLALPSPQRKMKEINPKTNGHSK